MALELTILLLYCYVSSVWSQCTAPLQLNWVGWSPSYKATYDSKNDVCIFSNVKFADAPRLQKPQDPTFSVAPSGPVSCPAVPLDLPCHGNPAVPPLGCLDVPISIDQEDCLYLDIYVPAAAYGTSASLPVVVWINGGGYIYGSKDDFNVSAGALPFYSGSGPISVSTTAKNEPKGIIFVAGNYRLGAYGWLAGTTMEQNATPNLGLYDQFQIFDFVKNYIHLVNGDSSQVSAWGESAGASSLMHHLIAENGTRALNFDSVLLQSPAFEWQWNQTGTLEENYQRFVQLAGCENSPGGNTTACLETIPSHKFKEANTKLTREIKGCSGFFPVGPSVDGTLITELAPLAFQSGNFNRNISALILSNVDDEVTVNGAAGFIPRDFKYPFNATTETFRKFLREFIPGEENKYVRNNIRRFYPSTAFPNLNQTLRVRAVIRDATFLCNNRYMFDAYTGAGKPLWMVNYAAGGSPDGFDFATHGSDLLPTFNNQDTNLTNIIGSCLDPGLNSNITGNLSEALTLIAIGYQSFFTSFATSNDPNANTDGFFNYTWTEAAADGANIANVMNVTGTALESNATHHDPFTTWTSTVYNSTVCDFWMQQASYLQFGNAPSNSFFGEEYDDFSETMEL